MPAYPGYRYQASGLSYVYLTNIDPPADGEITVPGINVLHDLIAEALITAPGSLGAQEVKYLRTHLGLTPEELGSALKMDGPQIRAVENDTRRSLDTRQNLALRLLVFAKLGINPPRRRTLVELCQARWSDVGQIRIAGIDGSSYRILPQDAL